MSKTNQHWSRREAVLEGYEPLTGEERDTLSAIADEMRRMAKAAYLDRLQAVGRTDLEMRDHITAAYIDSSTIIERLTQNPSWVAQVRGCVIAAWWMTEKQEADFLRHVYLWFEKNIDHTPSFP